MKRFLLLFYLAIGLFGIQGFNFQQNNDEVEATSIPASSPNSSAIDALSVKGRSYCRRLCGVIPPKDYDGCRCDAICLQYDNCCPDFHKLCFSCRGRCGSRYSRTAPCQCNLNCGKYKNCCPDFNRCNLIQTKANGENSIARRSDPYSCVGLCDSGLHPNKPCQCNPQCFKHGDCCHDYEKICLSCVGRCNDGFERDKPCQCNNQCSKHGNCCSDYEKICQSGGGESDELLQSVSEKLFALENENNGNQFVTIHLQGHSNNGHSDNAPEPLFKINEKIWDKPIYKKLLLLYNNYVPFVNEKEVETNEESNEISQFLDLVFGTPLMKELKNFLDERGYVRESDFERIVRNLWFDLYSRSGNILGSSGFEHVFLGEIKGDVSGFHNWIYFANEEENGQINYKGYMKHITFGNKGSLLSETFTWRGFEKSKSSMFIGFSPEFELSLYTLCFYLRQNKVCNLKLNNRIVKIKTFDIVGPGGSKLIGTAYPVL